MDTLLLSYWPLPLALLLSMGLSAALIRPARALGWVDRPSTRKHHRVPVPLVGGVAMCVAYCLGVLLLPTRPHGYREMLVGIVLLTLVGIYDDLRSARPAMRFLFQMAAVLLMALGGNVLLRDLGDLFGLGQVVLGSGALLFTLFGVVGVINAFNMIDGLDGLAGGLALIAVAWLIVLNQMAPIGHAGDSGALAVLALVIVGFLGFNLRHPWRARASVFMGDAGSTMLGFTLGWFMVHLSDQARPVMTQITAVWILAVPLLDTVTVMVRRSLDGHSPFEADRQHLHHLLLGYHGWSDARVTFTLLAAAALSGGLGVAAWWLGVPEFVQFYAFLVVFLLYYRYTGWMRARLRARVSAGTRAERRNPVAAERPLETALCSKPLPHEK